MNEQIHLPRVVLVDDDPEFLEDLQTLLSLKGFSFAFVRSQGEPLVLQTRQLVKQFRPHIVILDICLLDDLNPFDKSGLSLLPSVASAYCILCSNRLSNKLTAELQGLSNVTWIDKSRFEKLTEILCSGTKKMCILQKGLVIQWPSNFSSQRIIRSVLGSDADVPPLMPDDLLCQLFPEDTLLTLEHLGGKNSGSHEISRGRSVVLRVDRTNRVPRVVKIGLSERLQNEQNNYRDFVHGQLLGLFHARLERISHFWDIGSAVYSFVGLDEVAIPTFATFYEKESEPEVILQPLRHFFAIVWRHHYSNKVSSENESLFELYDKALWLSNRFPIIEQLITGSYAYLFADFTNPLSWLKEHIKESKVETIYKAVTHGDLHGDNLFVNYHHAWAIDFERTGPGHILRDFVELEIDIIVRLASLTNELFPEFVQTLISIHPSTEILAVSEQLKAEESAHKALRVIWGIRQIADEVTKSFNLREYLWGLLLDALFVTALPLAEPQQYERAFILASIICSHLQQVDDDNLSGE